MVDLLKLELLTISKVVKAKGFVCGCGAWNTLFYSTLSLEISFLKLESMDSQRKDFRFHFGKAFRKAEGIREKMAG